MSTTTKKNDPAFLLSYDRSMLRAALVSLFWTIISEKRKTGNFTFVDFAKKARSSKHEVSRWFSGKCDPNWKLNTVAAIANALDVDLTIHAVDRMTGTTYAANGIVHLKSRPDFEVSWDFPEKSAVVRDKPHFVTQISNGPNVAVGWK